MTQINTCPARLEDGVCYVLGERCNRLAHESCEEYELYVRPRGDDLYRAVIKTIQTSTRKG